MFKKKELENTTMGNSYGQETNLIIAETKLLGDLVTDHNIHMKEKFKGI